MDNDEVGITPPMSTLDAYKALLKTILNMAEIALRIEKVRAAQDGIHTQLEQCRIDLLNIANSLDKVGRGLVARVAAEEDAPAS